MYVRQISSYIAEDTFNQIPLCTFRVLDYRPVPIHGLCGTGIKSRTSYILGEHSSN